MSFESCNNKSSSLQMMVNSGARGTVSQIKQLILSRGYVTTMEEDVKEMPVIESYREGLSLINFFRATYSARRGLIDTTLKTASSGYLTRKLVEVAREYIISEEDCGTKTGLNIICNMNNNFIKHRLVGRVLAKEISYNNKIVFSSNTLITENNITSVLKCCGGCLNLRSPLTCQAQVGVCKLCYGNELSSNQLPSLGESVGTLAAQSVGEPGTQLTLRTFHGLNETIVKGDKSMKIKNCLFSPILGQTKYSHLSCITTQSGNIIVTTNCKLKVIQNNITTKSKLTTGTCLLTTNNKLVKEKELLCFKSISNG